MVVFCNECASYQCQDRVKLLSHLKSTHGWFPDEKFVCDLCFAQYLNSQQLANHLARVHSFIPRKLFFCNQCAYRNVRRMSFINHLVTVHQFGEQEKFACDLCSSIPYSSYANLLSHIKKFHSNTVSFPGESLFCEKCNYRNSKKHKLANHLRSTHGDIQRKKIICDICSAQYYYCNALKAHIASVHSSLVQDQFLCGNCPFRSNNKGNLKKHLHVHRLWPRTAFKCDECSREYQTKISLFQHLIQQDPLFCDVCQQKILRKTNLQQHYERVHSNIRNLSVFCSDCAYSGLKTNFKRHWKKRHSSVPKQRDILNCDICSKAIQSKRSLMRHVRICPRN